MACSGLTMQTRTLSSIDNVTQFRHDAAASVHRHGGQTHWHQKRLRWSSIEMELKISSDNAYGSPGGSHLELHVAAGRRTQTAPGVRSFELARARTYRRRVCNTEYLATEDAHFTATEDEQMKEWIEDVKSHLGSATATVDRSLWIVDRLERLGISRYFEQEITACLQRVYKNWSNEDGFGFKGGHDIAVLDDMNATAVAFRLFRNHGYHVTEQCFKRFVNRDGEVVLLTQNGFSCGSDFPAVLNLLRASEKLFPGEILLKGARAFTRTYLKRKHESEECGDHAAEVEFALKFPLYTSLPRLEHRAYIENELQTKDHLVRIAVADFNRCQEMHKKELEQVTRWNACCKFLGLEFARQKYVQAHFTAGVTLVDPGMAQARVVWSQCTVLTTVLDDYFDNCAPLAELRIFLQAVATWDPALVQGLPERAIILFRGLYETVNAIAAEAYIAQGRDVSHHLRSYWVRWLTACLVESEWAESGYVPSLEEYMAIAEVTISLETIICSAFFFVGEKLSEEALSSHGYHTPLRLVSRVGRILNDITGIERETLNGKKSSVHLYMFEHQGASESNTVKYLQELVDTSMQKLLEEVLRPTMLPRASKQLHLHMGKVLHNYYRNSDAYSTPTLLLTESINKILFAPLSDTLILDGEYAKKLAYLD